MGNRSKKRNRQGRIVYNEKSSKVVEEVTVIKRSTKKMKKKRRRKEDSTESKFYKILKWAAVILPIAYSLYRIGALFV